MIISIGNLNYNFLFPVIYTFSYCIRQLSFNYPPTSPYLIPFLFTISKLSIGILEIVINKHYRKQDSQYIITEDKNIETIQFNHTKLIPQYIRNKVTIIIFCFLYIIVSFLINGVFIRQFFTKFYFEKELFLYMILLSIGLEYFFEKTKKGKHQKMSICLFFGLTILITVVQFSSINSVSYFLLMAFEFYVTFQNYIERYIMSRFTVSPYILLFYEGILNIVVFLLLILFDAIYSIFYSNYFPNDKTIASFNTFINSFKNYKLLLLFFPSTLLIDIFLILTIESLSIMSLMFIMKENCLETLYSFLILSCIYW